MNRHKEFYCAFVSLLRIDRQSQSIFILFCQNFLDEEFKEK